MNKGMAIQAVVGVLASAFLSRAALAADPLPLVKPPWGRITAIDLNTGEHAWMVPLGTTPDFVRNHPALRGMNITFVTTAANDEQCKSLLAHLGMPFRK